MLGGDHRQSEVTREHALLSSQVLSFVESAPDELQKIPEFDQTQTVWHDAEGEPSVSSGTSNSEEMADSVSGFLFSPRIVPSPEVETGTFRETIETETRATRCRRNHEAPFILVCRKELELTHHNGRSPDETLSQFSEM